MSNKNYQSLVKNAADPKQVKRAKQLSSHNRDKQLEDIRAVMNTPQGRRFVWRVLQHCQVFGTIWEPSAKIHYNSGQQDVGHYIMAEIGEAGEELIYKLMTENYKKEDANV